MGSLMTAIDDLIDLSGGNVNKMYNIINKTFTPKKNNTKTKTNTNNTKKKK